MAFWKRRLWFSSKEEEDENVQQESAQQGRRKRKDSNRSNSSSGSSRSRSSNIQGLPYKPTWKDYLLLDTRMRVFYVLLLCLIIGLILPSVISYYLGEYQADLGNCDTPTLLKFECLSGSLANSFNKENCESAGCCWDSGSGKPKCYHKNPTRYTYEVVQILEDLPHKKVVELNPERRQTDMFGNTMSAAKAIVRAVNRHHVVVQLLTTDQPEDQFRLIGQDEEIPFSETDFEISVSTEKRKSFSVVVKRKDTHEVLLDTSYGPLAITDEYVEMSTKVPNEFIYGLGQGEQRSSFKRSFSSYGKTALYNRAGADSYHPFFMAASAWTPGFFHGVFWDNIYPLEVQLSPAMAVSFRSMGGSGVLHLFAGPTPADISRQWSTDMVGPSPLPPFWSLGFHLCRENDDPQVMRQTGQQMLDAGIPFDSDCIDLRLSGPAAGLADLERFPKALDDREWLRDSGKKFLLAQPPHTGLDLNQSDPDSRQWILHSASSSSEEYETGKRLNSAVFYPSYPSSIQFDWDAMLQPEGILLVDNWPSNQASNCLLTDRPRKFTPEKLQPNPSTGTVCLDAYHPNRELEHLAVHNHYGLDQLEHLTGQSNGYRMLYLNRASALGNLGRAGYPGEDYTANWLSMKMALVQVLEMGLFGISLAGSPICGAVNSSNVIEPQVDQEQLCLRWYQLGMLLPLAHSTTKLNHRPRSPVDWSPNTRRILAGYIQQRYRLLSYFYTLFYQASLEGTPVVRPVWYEFPSDKQTYLLSAQFMIGQSIMVCPAMIQQDSETSAPVSIYFPAGTWYDYYTGEWLYSSSSSTEGQGVVIMTPISHINMFIVNGTVFVTQEPGLSAEETRKNPYTVTTAFPILSDVVHGWLYVDDGITSDQSAHDLIRFNFTSDTFTMERLHNGFQGSETISTVVHQLRILGLELKEEQIPPGADYHVYTKVLEFNNLNFDWAQMETHDVYTLKFINSDL